jgi:hypothetical protein
VYFLDAASGQRVYQVTAQTQSEDARSLPELMPYLIRSAFTGFPAESGKPHRVTLPLEKTPEQVLPSPAVQPVPPAPPRPQGGM